MDLSRSLRSLAADRDRPGARLILTCRQVAHESEQMVACRDQLLETGFLNSQIGEELRLLLVIQLDELLLDLCGDDKDFRLLICSDLPDLLHIGVGLSVIREVVLLDIGRIDDRLVRQQIKARLKAVRILVAERDLDRFLSLLELLLQFHEDLILFLCVLVRA